MKKLVWLIQASLFYLFTLIVAAFPRSQSIRIGKNVGAFLFKILHSRRIIAINNISKALPFMKSHPAWTGEFETAEEIAKATFMNLGISVVEVCRLYHDRGDMLIDSFEVQGRENLVEARKKHNGLLFFTAHCGNWELLSLSYNKMFGENMWVIARHQKNPYLNAVIEKMRVSYGSKIIYSKNALRPILGAIKKDGIIGMLADQAVFEDNGALIDFLGRKAWANKAPAIIAHKTGVPLIPAFSHRKGDRHVLKLYPEYKLCGDRTEVGVQKDIQALSCYLEDFVCAHPADWYWIHRRWKRAGDEMQ